MGFYDFCENCQSRLWCNYTESCRAQFFAEFDSITDFLDEKRRAIEPAPDDVIGHFRKRLMARERP